MHRRNLKNVWLSSKLCAQQMSRHYENKLSTRIMTLKASFDELAEDADELSDALRKQLKELGVELSTTDLDNETGC